MVLSFKKEFKAKILEGSKIHTIRTNGKRWSVCRKIHFATGVRTKNYECFKEGFVTDIQYIKILPDTKQIFISAKNKFFELEKERVLQFCKNDGFETEKDFWEFFPVRFDGVLIHWNDTYYYPLEKHETEN
jgi:predicted HicB family RNase H-like nuclease